MKLGIKKSEDWCHLCGERSQFNVDIWYPKNAEHDTENTEYIRICARCAHKIILASQIF